MSTGMEFKGEEKLQEVRRKKLAEGSFDQPTSEL